MARSGAKDVRGIDAIMRYARPQGLIPSLRLYTFKAAQNAGTGSAIYGVGSLTAVNGSIYGGAPWEAGGIPLNGSTQGITWTDFLSAATLTTFIRITQPTATPASVINPFGQ